MTDIDAFLRERGIHAQRHEHAAVMTVEESQRLVPPLPGAKTKNLFLRDGKGRRHFLVTVRHDVAVDLDALGSIIGAGRLGFASPERLHEASRCYARLGEPAGAVQRPDRSGRIRHRSRAVGGAGLTGASADQYGYDDPVACRPRALCRSDGSHAAHRRHSAQRCRTECGAMSPSADPIVRVVDVHKSFGAVEVLKGVTLAVTQGEAVCIIGPSGSGKSTLLRCINGLIAVDRGEVYVGPHAVHTLRTDSEMVALRKDVSIVFQQYNLFPHKTALENLMMAPVQVLKAAAGRGARTRCRTAEEGAAGRQGKQLPGRAVGWPAATGGHCACVGDAPVGDVVRRGHRCARPGNGEGSAADDQATRRRRHDVDSGDARDGVCARDRQPRLFHRPRCHRRARCAGNALRESATRTHSRVPASRFCEDACTSRCDRRRGRRGERSLSPHQGGVDRCRADRARRVDVGFDLACGGRHAYAEWRSECRQAAAIHDQAVPEIWSQSPGNRAASTSPAASTSLEHASAWIF